jgi:hypothetical protein
MYIELVDNKLKFIYQARTTEEGSLPKGIQIHQTKDRIEITFDTIDTAEAFVKNTHEKFDAWEKGELGNAHLVLYAFALRVKDTEHNRNIMHTKGQEKLNEFKALFDWSDDK